MHSICIEYLGNSVELPFGETAIGRDVGCALRFNDPSVSRKHLRLIRRQDDELFVEDLGSSNGTLLNGRKIAAALRLQDGDKIQFGSREIGVCISDGGLDDRPTLVLSGLAAAAAQQPMARAYKGFAEGVKYVRGPTVPMAAVGPAPMVAHQRCPNCGAPVSDVEDECMNCDYNWGSFRPMSRTDVGPTPVVRRRHERHQIELRLIYRSSELEIEAMTRDLSESGVFVCSQVLDPVGTRCHLTILVDGAPPLAISGVVRRVIEHVDDRSDATGLGVQFIDLGPREHDWLVAVLARPTSGDGT